MKVIANERGFFGGEIRELGEEFSIENEKQLGSWMTPLDAKDAPKGKSSAKSSVDKNDENVM
jgi:hypothetical protein